MTRKESFTISVRDALHAAKRATAATDIELSRYWRNVQADCAAAACSKYRRGFHKEDTK